MSTLRAAVAFMAIALVSFPVAAGHASGPAGPSLAAARVMQAELVGTWKAASGNYGGRAFTFPEDQTTLKHVTPTQFTVVTFDKDGKVTRVIGGSYTLKDNVYEEVPFYGVGGDFDIVKGKTQSFTWKIAQHAWHITGTISNGLAIEEVWERVPKK